MSNPAISFKNVTKRFGAITAVEAVGIEIHPGEFVSLVGPSGCGKSTLLKLGSGLEMPTGGTIERATDNIGYVFQEPTLMPWRTVRRNVEFLAELEGVGRKTRRSHANEVLRLVGLDEFADHYPIALSGGMKMRASVARALLLNPELFLLDEPFGALDQITRGNLDVELMNLFVDRQFATLFVTHSVDEALFLASRLLVMSDRPGHIVAEFTVPYTYPRDPAIRYEPEFAILAGQVAEVLGEAS